MICENHNMGSWDRLNVAVSVRSCVNCDFKEYKVHFDCPQCVHHKTNVEAYPCRVCGVVTMNKFRKKVRRRNE